MLKNKGDVETVSLYSEVLITNKRHLKIPVQNNHKTGESAFNKTLLIVMQNLPVDMKSVNVGDLCLLNLIPSGHLHPSKLICSDSSLSLFCMFLIDYHLCQTIGNWVLYLHQLQVITLFHSNESVSEIHELISVEINLMTTSV